MFHLDSYEILNEHPLKNGVKIYDARHIASGSRVNIQFLQMHDPSRDALEAAYRYFLPLKKSFSPHLARVYDVEKIRKPSLCGVAFIIEEVPGTPLKAFLGQNGPMAPAEFFPVAVDIATAINDLHKAGLAHCWLTTSAFTIDSQTGNACLTDYAFGMGTPFLPTVPDNSGKDRTLIPGDHLPYISPEQTGRMKRDVDYRTDFYSLGILFHEMLFGKPPFAGSPMEIIHAHMARQPELSDASREKIGESLSRILLKLLSKSPESRYQSAWGIRSDLLKCRTHSDGDTPRVPFAVAEADVSEQFRFPGKLYGRDIEVAMLVDEFHRIKENNVGIFMIAGYSGIGKTRLVEELQRHIVEDSGYFISGQYEPLQQDIPYSGLIPAFAGIVRQILTEPVDRIDHWRETLSDALGSNAAVLVEVLPELEFIVGKQPSPPVLSPKDAQNRFHVVFEKFLQALTAPGHPLTLFIDNMQWADSAALKLMESLFIGSETRHFYFVGAYRTNDISSSHPLFDSLAAIRHKGLPVQTLTLKPLGESDVCRMLADALRTDMDQVQLLGQVICDKTRGNPFFIRQFIDTVTHAGFFFYDFTAGRWQWDIEKIATQGITENVVDFMTAKIRLLGASVLESLRIAACIGDSFSLALLFSAAEKSRHAIVTDLTEAVALGLVLARGGHWRYVEKFPAADFPAAPEVPQPPGPSMAAEDVTFEFVHDKLRQAIYAEIPDALKQQYHGKIGKLLYAGTEPKNLASRIFSIVHHFNQLSPGDAADPDPEMLARLNLLAGIRAKDAAAYRQAHRYLTAAEALLPDDDWTDWQDLVFDIKKHRMECEYLLQHFEAADQLFQVLLSRADSDERRAELYNQKMIMLASLAKHEEALEIGCAGLGLLGVKLPEKAGKLDVLKSLMTLKFRLRGKDIDALVDLPEISDPRRLLVLRMMMNLSLSAYFCQPYLASYLALYIFRITLKHGNSSVSPFAYVIYGAALCGLFREYAAGYRFGELAMKVKNRFGGASMNAKVLLYFANGITLWTRHLSQVIALNRKGLESARDTGDLNYTVYHIQSLVFTMLAAGRSIDEVGAECERYYEFVEKIHDVGALNYLISVIQFVKCLRGDTFHIHSLDDDHFSESRHVKNIESDDIKLILCRHHLIKLRLLYIMEDYEGALKAARQCGALRQYHIGTIIIPEYYVYHCLTLAALYPSVSALKKSFYRRQMRFFCRHMGRFAAQCPDNFEDKYLLIQAEIARVAGQDRRAIDFYQQAIQSANARGFTQYHAISNEAAARFYMARGYTDIAATFMQKARESYHRWGARAKVALLEKNFPRLLTPDPATHRLPMEPDLDITAIVTALQAISTEIVLADLLKSLMKIVLETAGARKAQFLSITSDRMFLEAQNHIDDKETVVYQSLPVEGRPELFSPVLNYVKRARTFLVLEDAAREGAFTRDPYVLNYHPRSVLCLPVIRHNRMSALLYLENDITPSVFTPERIRVLGLLASQAAISLENARLYESVIHNEKVLREISEKREEESLRYQSQLRSLSSELSLAEERERRRIASDLHDRIGHALANASMKLRLVKNATSLDAAARHMDAIHALIDQSISDTQSLTFELSPPILYDLGLEAALDWLAEQTQQQHDIRVEFIDDLSYKPLHKPIDESLRILLFQASRELLHNVVKHARADRIRVTISGEYIEQEDMIRITIEDNGVGFAATRNEKDVKKGGFGIFSIEERLKHQGGRLEITSDPETGSRVTMISPMAAIEIQPVN